MSTRFFNSPHHKGYGSFWNKYRPVILNLMMASDKESQEYKLYKHELNTLNTQDKSYSFTLEVQKGKAVNNIRNSNIAMDLLDMLIYSPKAVNLMNDHRYIFNLDKKFVLHINRQAYPEPVLTEEEKQSK